jgi:hypothetical protein
MGEHGEKPQDGRTMFDELVELLDVAVAMTAACAKDPVLQRLLEAFRLMPFEDREVLVGAIEREVRARRLSRATEDATGHKMHANRHARLYVRAHETPMPRRNLEREELMLSMLRGMRVSPLLLAPEVHDEWLEGTREALAHLEPDARAAVVELTRELLALAEETEAPRPRRAVRAG